MNGIVSPFVQIAAEGGEDGTVYALAADGTVWMYRFVQFQELAPGWYPLHSERHPTKEKKKP